MSEQFVKVDDSHKSHSLDLNKNFRLRKNVEFNEDSDEDENSLALDAFDSDSNEEEEEEDIVDNHHQQQKKKPILKHSVDPVLIQGIVNDYLEKIKTSNNEPFLKKDIKDDKKSTSSTKRTIDSIKIPLIDKIEVDRNFTTLISDVANQFKDGDIKQIITKQLQEYLIHIHDPIYSWLMMIAKTLGENTIDRFLKKFSSNDEQAITKELRTIERKIGSVKGQGGTERIIELLIRNLNVLQQTAMRPRGIPIFPIPKKDDDGTSEKKPSKKRKLNERTEPTVTTINAYIPPSVHKIGNYLKKIHFDETLNLNEDHHKVHKEWFGKDVGDDGGKETGQEEDENMGESKKDDGDGGETKPNKNFIKLTSTNTTTSMKSKNTETINQLTKMIEQLKKQQRIERDKYVKSLVTNVTDTVVTSSIQAKLTQINKLINDMQQEINELKKEDLNSKLELFQKLKRETNPDKLRFIILNETFLIQLNDAFTDIMALMGNPKGVSELDFIEHVTLRKYFAKYIAFSIMRDAIYGKITKGNTKVSFLNMVNFELDTMEQYLFKKIKVVKPKPGFSKLSFSERKFKQQRTKEKSSFSIRSGSKVKQPLVKQFQNICKKAIESGIHLPFNKYKSDHVNTSGSKKKRNRKQKQISKKSKSEQMDLKQLYEDPMFTSLIK